MGKNHSGKGVPKAGTNLIRNRTIEVFVDSMFKYPNNNCDEEEGAGCNEP